MQFQIKTITLVFICQILLSSCNFFGREKSKNELEYDSLITIIAPEKEFLQRSVSQIESPAGRDSSLNFIEDISDLSYPEIKEKYALNDSVSERQFLDALAITAEIVTANKKLQKMIGM